MDRKDLYQGLQLNVCFLLLIVRGDLNHVFHQLISFFAENNEDDIINQGIQQISNFILSLI